MKTVPFRIIPAFILGILLIASAGCATSAPSRFYTLNSLAVPATLPPATSAEKKHVIAVVPVAVPEYLDRPQIVTRSGKNELKLSEFNRWAGSFNADVTRVLVENLSVLLAREPLTVLRWVPAEQALLPVKYRIGVQLTGFDGSPGGTVLLRAQWTLFGENGRKAIFLGESNITEQTGGQEYEDLVDAMSRALESLSRDIAAAIISR
ncbi:MAG: PqiC family protein [Nitrospirota bacterium]|nr:PqiC family protein [Nitrospirota bacterium]